MNTLIVDNNDICEPLRSRIEYSALDDLNRGQDSSRTYIFDIDGVHTHTFGEVEHYLLPHNV